MLGTTISSRPIASRITNIFWDHSSEPSDHLRPSTLSNLTLDETVTAASLADDKIDCRNLRYSGSRPRPAVASEAQSDMMVVVVVVVVKVVEQY
jgi:hypothetical protein